MFCLSQESKSKLHELIKRYPVDRGALIPALWLVQEECGFVSDEAVEYVAAELGLAPSEVYGAVTFYTMFGRRKIGEHHIRVCTNICCWLKGSRDILDYLKAKLGIGVGETTKDGAWTLSTVECLGACGGAPMMMVDNEYYEDLTFDRIDEILASLRSK